MRYPNTTVVNLRQELTTALEALQAERDKVAQLEGRIETLRDDCDATSRRKDAQRDVERKRYEDQLTAQRQTNARLFARHDFEAMTRQQLVSLIEGAINEARRKGMTEAEGLLSRHQNLERETDLELMRGVVKEYQARIDRVVADQEAAARAQQQKVQLDTRPLKEKLDDAVVHRRVSNLPTWDWWRMEPATYVAETPSTNVTNTAGSFARFDATAKSVTLAAQAKSFGIGSKVTVKGATGGTYILARPSEDLFSCTCPAWQFQRVAPEARSCKHLEAYLGVQHEAVRTTKALAKPVTGTKCWCGTELVRGQCQEHTTDWKGDELCTCGRKFSACKAAYGTLSVAQRKKGHQPRLGVKTAWNFDGVRF